jgi:ribosome maturation factor RimP
MILKIVCSVSGKILHLQRNKETIEGNGKRSLLYCRYMNLEQKAAGIKDLAEQLIAADKNVFLVDVKLKPGNNIQVFVDADAGLPLSKCVEYNRVLYKQLDESGMFADGDFSLEVSSPGLDEPLKLERQYLKNIGRNVEVVLKDGGKITGKLLSAGAEIIVEETRGKGKKQEVLQHALSFDQIKSTKIQIVFN